MFDDFLGVLGTEHLQAETQLARYGDLGEGTHHDDFDEGSYGVELTYPEEFTHPEEFTLDEPGPSDPVSADAVADIGTPLLDAPHWHEQTGANSCAVVAQASILEEVEGIPFDEQAACDEAERLGLFDPDSGTAPWAVGELLEAHGIDCSSRYEASLLDMADALEHGDKVIVGLNANEIWTPVHDPSTGAPVQQAPAGHAVWVTGLDERPDGSLWVLMNDSGTPGGRMEAVEVHDFMNAWADHGNFMVVADVDERGAA